ncbi:Alpha/Beta hydrolase protein [Diaporthe sp. PMI_573]|nr:Alpha/Beta hydrolase protein [Diaporthaceae sp. PMI_573]
MTPSSVFLLLVTTCSAALASLNHLPPEIVAHHAARVAEGRHDNVTTDELDRFRIYAQYAGAAYCHPFSEGDEVFCNGDICPSMDATYSAKIQEDLGFIAVDHTLEEIVVSFRGTVLRWEWLANVLRSRPSLWEASRCPGDCMVHSGWQDAEAEVNDGITKEVKRLLHEHPRYNITVVGHSRGGALATILAAHLRMDLRLNVTTYTYGSPRVGNEAFARFVFEQGDRNYRITHYNDIVPIVPPSRLDYQHVEPEYWLREGPWSRVDYKPRDLEECHDWTEVHCIEGNVGQCGKPDSSISAADELSWNTAEYEEFMASLRHDFADDIAYTASLHNHSLLAEYRWTIWEDN